MLAINIRLKNDNSNLVMFFDDYDRALMNFEVLNTVMESIAKKSDLVPAVLKIKDDYTHELVIYSDDLRMVLFTDVQTEVKATEAIKMIEARANASLQRKMKSDAALALHQSPVNFTA